MLPGKRLCAGETYARHTMFLILSTLIQNFTVKRAPGKPLPSEEPDMPGIIVTKKDFWLKFEPRAWHSLNPHYRLLFCGQTEYKLQADVEIIVRDSCNMKKWNVSFSDWLNFMNLSVSIPRELESLITLRCESFGIFLSCTYLYSTPFKLHAPPTPPHNWTLIMFGEKQPRLLYCINKVFKTLQIMHNLLLIQLCVRFLCIHRPTWQWGLPVPAHNQNFRNTAVWTSLISRKGIYWEAQQDHLQMVQRHIMSTWTTCFASNILIP